MTTLTARTAGSRMAGSRLGHSRCALSSVVHYNLHTQFAASASCAPSPSRDERNAGAAVCSGGRLQSSKVPGRRANAPRHGHTREDPQWRDQHTTPAGWRANHKEARRW
jgi:hypothetical protein